MKYPSMESAPKDRSILAWGEDFVTRKYRWGTIRWVPEIGVFWDMIDENTKTRREEDCGYWEGEGIGPFDCWTDLPEEPEE